MALVVKQTGVSTERILHQGFCIPGSFEIKMDFFSKIIALSTIIIIVIIIDGLYAV